MKSVILASATRDKVYINLDKILELPFTTNFKELVETLKNNMYIKVTNEKI